MSDYISREAAIETAVDYRIDVIENEYDRGYQIAVQDIAKGLNAIPAADVRPVVHGRWLETYQPFGWSELACATCSECGEDFVLDEWAIDDLRASMKYCPTCGAKMDLEAEE